MQIIEKTAPANAVERQFETDYGYFRADGRAYIIKRADTPRPWVNVISNERYGMVISQAGGGFSWVDHSALSVLTRWEMDLVRDSWGKWIYLRDEESGELWSAAPQPTMATLDAYECEHGIGWTKFTASFGGIETEWTLTVPPARATLELWRLRIRNQSGRKRRLSICSHFMWCLGNAPDSKREFHRLFFTTDWNAETGLTTAQKDLWEVPTAHDGHWNTSFPHLGFHAVWNSVDGSVPLGVSAVGDHELFVGLHGKWDAPEWLGAPAGERVSGGFGRSTDPIAAICVPVELSADAEAEVELVFALGVAENSHDPADAVALLEPYRRAGIFERVLTDVAAAWNKLLPPVEVETPDAGFNLMTNIWLPYQTISGRLWGRTGYWQQSGAFGFRDQLQDSQVYLPRAPERCLAQIRLHARHQFADGTVYHWWHPLSEVGLRTQMVDDLLWLPFVLHNYILETGDLRCLDLEEPYVDEATPAPLWDHCHRAFDRVFQRMSPRGLPLIGAGDWNDGLSACGLQMRGESVWMGHFLYGLLRDWTRIASERGDDALTKEWSTRADKLRMAVNEHGWDGDYYYRGTLDDGSKFGSAECDEGKIFLNPQTWSVISGTADQTRARQAMDAVEKHLLRDFGTLLLTPSYTIPKASIGYLTRYAPGSRENGGVYTHAACWAVQAACMAQRPGTAWAMYSRLAPPTRGMDPVHYAVEPYVTPGNVDGPESPYYGRGGWTWYTGSAGWLQRIASHYVLGVRPTWEGLLISPCLPPGWPHASLRRQFRGDTFEISFENADGIGGALVSLEVDGVPHDPAFAIPASGKNRTRKVVGVIGRSSPSIKEPS